MLLKKDTFTSMVVLSTGTYYMCVTLTMNVIIDHNFGTVYVRN